MLETPTGLYQWQFGRGPSFVAAIWLWVRSEQRHRRASLFGLAMVITVGLGCALALAAGAHRADTVYQRFTDRTGAATIVMSELDAGLPTNVADANRHLEVLDRVRSIDGVESVQVATWFGANPIVNPAIYPQTPNDQGLVQAFSQGSSYFDPAHPPLLIVAGTLPAPDDPEGIVINEAAAELGLRIGSTIDFETAAASQFAEWANADGLVRSYDGPRMHTVVKAIGRSFQEIADPRTPNFLVTPGVAAAMGNRVVSCSCFVGVRIRPGQVDEVRAQLDEIYRPYGLVERPGDSGSVITESVRVEASTLLIAALVAAAAALLVVAQFAARSASSLVARNDAQRALGMIRAQRAGGIALVMAPAVVIGVVAAGITAFLMSGLFPRGLALRAEPQPGLRLDRVVLGWGGLGLFVALALMVAVVSWRSTAVPQPRSPIPDRVFMRLLSNRPQRSMGGNFALDPTGGRPTPLAALVTLVGVAFAAGGIVAVATIEYSRDDARSDHRIFGAPADYWFNDNGSAGAPGAVEFAMAKPGITAVTRTVAIDDSTTPALGPSGSESQVEPTSFEALRGGALPTLSKGSMPRGDDEVTVGAATARELGVGVGDSVSIVDVGKVTRSFRVVGLVVSWGQDDPGHAFIVNPSSLLGLLCVGGVESGCNVQVSVWAQPVAAVNDAATSNANASTATIDGLTSAGFVRIQPPANLDRLQQVGNIPWYLAVVLGALGLAGVGHAVATALRRRGVDLAIGRALGWTPRQSAAVLIWQAALISLAGGVVGAALGLLVGRGIWTVIADGLDIVVRPATPLGIAALSVAGIVVASVVVSLPAYIRACRLGTAQILRTD